MDAPVQGYVFPLFVEEVNLLGRWSASPSQMRADATHRPALVGNEGITVAFTIVSFDVLVDLKANPDCPYLLQLKPRLLSYQLAFVPRYLFWFVLE